ncbi:MAG: type II toxin-antitoxin system prevent-host-death family antitoxin [Acidimicrobiia bacterium]|nr:type II toxin-antitoxin system prevent-host-death family antitoxin [Acidimicrobiia bacterium]
MTTVSIPELRNNGGAAVERASRGERIVITSSGEPVAELAPLPKRPAHRVALVTARRHLPPVDPEALRCDVDLFIDQSTCPLPDGNPRYQHAATARTDHGPSVLPDHPLITAITLAELSVGPHVASNDAVRAAGQQHPCAQPASGARSIRFFRQFWRLLQTGTEIVGDRRSRRMGVGESGGTTPIRVLFTNLLKQRRLPELEHFGALWVSALASNPERECPRWPDTLVTSRVGLWVDGSWSPIRWERCSPATSVVDVCCSG